MKLHLALVEFEGVPFGLVRVGDDLFDDPARRDESLAFYEARVFRDLPVVMVGAEFPAPRLHGRDDLVALMKDVEMAQIEWSAIDFPLTPPGVS